MIENYLKSFNVFTGDEIEEFLTNQPAYLKQIPLNYLASYLGITPRHLSRIRKAILK